MRKCDLYIHHTSIYDDNSYSPWVNPKFVAIGIIATLAVISLLIAVTSLDGTPVCEATGGGRTNPTTMKQSSRNRSYISYLNRIRQTIMQERC